MRFHWLSCRGRGKARNTGSCAPAVRNLRTTFPDPWSSRGSILVVMVIALFLCIFLCLVVVEVATYDLNRSYESWQKEQALAAAEAGIDNVIWLLNHTNGPGWRTTPGAPYTGTMPDSHAAYNVVVEDATVSYAAITLVSTGVPEGNSAIHVTAQAQLQLSGSDSRLPWQNAIFGGSSPALDQFTGQTNIHGSIHLLGEGEPGDSSGTLYYDNNGDSAQNPQATGSSQLPVSSLLTVFNTYSGIENSAFANKVPALSKDSSGHFTLSARLRLQYGQVLVGAGINLGEALPDPLAVGFVAAKNTIDGSYVGDGSDPPYTGLPPGPLLGGPYSDNGASNPYDLTAGSVQFPSILYPVTGSGDIEYPPASRQSGDYADWISYISPLAADFNGALTLDDTDLQSSLGPPPTDFPGFNPKGTTIPGTTLKWYRDPSDGNADILEIHGIIHVKGPVTLGQAGEVITVRGNGTIVAGGTVAASGNVVTVTGGQEIRLLGGLVSDGFTTSVGGFPTNVLGLLSCGDIITSGGPDYMGAFFAQHGFIESAPANIGGAIVCSYFHANNGPFSGHYYVPALANHLPPGLPGAPAADPTARVSVVNYQVQ